MGARKTGPRPHLVFSAWTRGANIGSVCFDLNRPIQAVVKREGMIEGSALDGDQ